MSLRLLPRENVLFCYYETCFLGCKFLNLLLFFYVSSSSSLSQATKLNPGQDPRQGRGFILLPLRAAVLPRLDAGSGGVKPTSSCVIQNLQTSCSSWYMM